MEPKHKLDQWLDQALAEYGHAEPRTGLETRVLANLAAEKTRATRRDELYGRGHSRALP